MVEEVTGGTDLPHSPTWATAVVQIIMVALSGFLEFLIDKFTQALQDRRLRRLTFFQVPLEKMKQELMMMGLMAILLNFLEIPISKICISGNAGHIILPCTHADKEAARWDHCVEKGKVALTSRESMQHLHMFMLVLPGIHVLYSLAAMALARYIMKSWKEWESTARGMEHVTTIAAARSSCPNGAETSIMAFFRQFYQPMREEDYRIMRLRFIEKNRKLENYDFYTYITRLFEKDMNVFMGISFPLRLVAILPVLINIHGTGMLILISPIPLVILLVIGAKLVKVYLQLEFNETDPSFWFNRPGIIRFLIRLALFENAFLMAHFLWAMATSSLRNCYYKNMVLGITGAVIGIAFQIFCGLVTFPLYAIVSKMAIVLVVENRDVNRPEENMVANTAAENGNASTAAENGDASTAVENGDANMAAENGDANTAEENGDANMAAENGDANTAEENADANTVEENAEASMDQENVDFNRDVENVDASSNVSFLGDNSLQGDTGKSDYHKILEISEISADEKNIDLEKGASDNRATKRVGVDETKQE